MLKLMFNAPGRKMLLVAELNLQQVLKALAVDQSPVLPFFMPLIRQEALTERGTELKHMQREDLVKQRLLMVQVE